MRICRQQLANVKFIDTFGSLQQQYSCCSDDVYVGRARRGALARALAEQHHFHGGQANHEVQKQAVVLHIVEVKLQFLPCVIF